MVQHDLLFNFFIMKNAQKLTAAALTIAVATTLVGTPHALAAKTEDYPTSGDDEVVLDIEWSFEQERPEILKELAEEVAEIEDKVIQAKAKDALKKLAKITDEGNFFDVLDAAYGEIDAYYEANYSFEDERKEIMEELTEEMNETKDKAEKEAMKNLLTILKKTDDENKFFEEIEKAYKNFFGVEFNEEDYEDEDYDFATEKQEIIKELKEEVNEIEDTTLKASVEKTIANLETINDEETFFETLDAQCETVDAYYEANYSFEDERKAILTEIESEVALLQSQLAELEKIETEEDFWKALDTQEAAWDEMYDDEDDDFDFDFDDEDEDDDQ